MRIKAVLAIAIAHYTSATLAASLTSLLSSSFDRPSTGNALWYRTPAANWVFESLPIGSGHLGAAVFSGVENDTVILNIDDLWEGGPFADPAYNGANWDASEVLAVHQRLNQLRATIFANGTSSDLNNITSEAGAYGTFTSAGQLNVVRTGASGNYTSYTRWLDMDQGIVRATWKEGSTQFRREYVCSYPDNICSHRTSSSKAVPQADYSITPNSDHSNINFTCTNNSTFVLRGQAGQSNTGMLYEVIGSIKALSPSSARSSCTNGVISIYNATDVWFVWTGATEYNIDAGTSAQGYSFRGPDPHAKAASAISSVTSSYTSFFQRHTSDYTSGTSQNFHLTLGQQVDWSKSTDELVQYYKDGGPVESVGDNGRLLLEWLLFNYGRHLMFSSARGNLPANLQGVWSLGAGAPWSGDYHANINVQQMYWPVETTGMDITQTLWDFIQKTIVPRGGDTAQILYNVSRGWAMHDETNVFGSTGMKGLDIPNYNPAEWTDYAAAGAWLMLHVWDHFDYTGDVNWLRQQGYPLLKVTAEYWLDALQSDAYSKDGSLVVNPCNSPELPQTTFGCAHWQQVIWELFNAVDKSLSVLGNPSTESTFLSEVRSKRAKLDRGLKVGSGGKLQEWKLDLDNSAQLTHRHLSPLIGLYPSYSISSFDPHTDGIMPNLTRSTLIDASTALLISRGNGTASDGDAGWEKVWRAACWAQLGKPDKYYYQLSYGIARNFGSNLWSVYNPFNTAENTLYQQDANGGFPAAVINALVQAPDTQSLETALTIALLPSLPASWKNGQVRGLRTRRGLEVDLTWANGALTKATLRAPRLLSGKALSVTVKMPTKTKQTTIRKGDSVTLV